MNSQKLNMIERRLREAVDELDRLAGLTAGTTTAGRCRDAASALAEAWDEAALVMEVATSRASRAAKSRAARGGAE